MNQVADKITFPPVVYVPCSPLTSGDEELSVDLRQTRTGKLALLVYSALDRLVTCCGEQQPWVVLPTANLEKIREQTSFELILLDIDIPDQFRRHNVEVNR
ncbi:MAG: SAV_915 family protein [Pseudonocardiaceae bacterium]